MLARSARRPLPLLALVVPLMWCAGCGTGDETGVDGRPPAAAPYDGPLTARAAVGALECEGDKPYLRARGVYDDGLSSAQASVEQAFDDLAATSGLGFNAPVEGYRIEREEPHRALLSYDVGERTKVAVVVADGIRDYNGDVGWGALAWATCDPSEYPAAVSDELNFGVWQDASGRRMPVTRLRSLQGAEHCSWTQVTFLVIGPDLRRGDWFVRNPTEELGDYLHGAYEPESILPRDATDTGWSRAGRELWLAADRRAAYLVKQDDPADVERWPAATEPIWCA